VGTVNRLYYRFGTESSQLGPWILYSSKSKRTLGTLFLNPEENLYLANIRLIAELPSSLEYVENLVCFEISKTGSENVFFQFKAGEFTSDVKECSLP
jgi:hypothetical protein